MRTQQPPPLYMEPISIIGAGKNNLGNAPTVILEKVSGNQVKNLTLLIGQVDITLLN